MCFGMSSKALGNKRRATTPERPERLQLLEEDVQGDYFSGEEEFEGTIVPSLVPRKTVWSWRQKGEKVRGLRADKKDECKNTRRKISGLKR